MVGDIVIPERFVLPEVRSLSSNEYELLKKNTSMLSVRATEKTPEEKDRLESGLPRIPREQLEEIYIKDPIVFNGINYIIKTLLASNPGIEKTGVEEIDKEMAVFQERVDFVTFAIKSIAYMCIYGPAFAEAVYNRAGNDIVDLAWLDPKTMDYQKGPDGRIMMDEKTWLPIGWEQKLPMGKQPKKIAYDKIIQFSLYTIGEGFYPIGLIEPIYAAALSKLNIQQSDVDATTRHGTPVFIAYVGDKDHRPTPQNIKDILDKMKNMSSKTELAVPYYYKIDVIEPKHAEKIVDHLRYYEDEEIAGIGIPKPFILGYGEHTGKATLLIQDQVCERTLSLIRRAFSNSFERGVLAVKAKLRGWKVVPKVKWTDVNTQDLIDKCERLVKYKDAGLLVADKGIRDFVRGSENLPKEDLKTAISVGKKDKEEVSDTKEKPEEEDN